MKTSDTGNAGFPPVQSGILPAKSANPPKMHCAQLSTVRSRRTARQKFSTQLGDSGFGFRKRSKSLDFNNLSRSFTIFNKQILLRRDSKLYRSTTFPHPRMVSDPSPEGALQLIETHPIRANLSHQVTSGGLRPGRMLSPSMIA